MGDRVKELSQARSRKEKLVIIKREKYRGKYTVVLREKGRVIERRPWTASISKKRSTGINTKAAITNYNQNRSIFDNRKRVTGETWKVVEESRFAVVQANKKSDVMPKIDRAMRVEYRYYIRGFIERKTGANIEVVASSQTHKADFSVDKARNEAWTSFYERVSHLWHGKMEGKYDENEGLRIVEQGNVRIVEEGVVHYHKK